MLLRTSLFASLVFLASCDSSSTSPVVSEPAVTDQSQALLDNIEVPSEEIETDSGLIYQVIEAGDGESRPNADSLVTLHYIGTLLDGTLFDSSYARGEPSTFELLATIEGFREGVQLMSIGARYRFTIPAHLGYGSAGIGDIIGPDETLVFEVRLLEINS